MSIGSILGLTDEIIPKNKTVKFSAKIEVDKYQKDRTDNLIQKSFFRDKSVYINLTDAFLIERIQNALTSAGAKVTLDFLLAEFIISPKPVKFNIPNPSTSRGSMLLKNANIQHELPKVILLKQIPWVFRDPEADKQPSNDDLIIVADLFSRYRPIFQKDNHKPQLHFGSIPKGYTITPFEQIPSDLEPTMKKIQSHLKPRDEGDYIRGPQNGDYCELCGCSFPNAELHHSSQEHCCNSTDHEWEEFDNLSNYITKTKYLSMF